MHPAVRLMRILVDRYPADRKISMVVVGDSPWWLLRQHLDAIIIAVDAATPGSYAEVDNASQLTNKTVFRDVAQRGKFLQHDNLVAFCFDSPCVRYSLAGSESPESTGAQVIPQLPLQ